MLTKIERETMAGETDTIAEQMFSEQFGEHSLKQYDVDDTEWLADMFLNELDRLNGNITQAEHDSRRQLMLTTGVSLRAQERADSLNKLTF